MERKKFTPAIGQTYKNRGGGTYRCLNTYKDHDAKMVNTATGWTLIAHGCGSYEDGTMDWDYSTGGYFEKGETK